jgi:adenosylcobinamide kinase / adenosylcobinamide-phosphate guanylyltransferase
LYNENNKITLILGGARSGKSSCAQELASYNSKVLFLATAEALDDEMARRIEAHRKSRPSEWDTIEAQSNIVDAVNKIADKYDAVIIDCITILVSNHFRENLPLNITECNVKKEITNLVDLLSNMQSNYIIVSNEVGCGLVPDNALSRTYRDTLGYANQQLAKCANEVYLMTAGLKIRMK